MRFLFADYALDTGRRELTHGADLVSIGPQVFDLLVYLVEHRASVVSKDELLENIWRGRTVSESTLISQINAARKAVGDSGEKQALIRTVARKGFRFIGEVREAQTADDLSAAKSASSTQFGEKSHEPSLTLSDKPTIAVLPFQNMSDDSGQEYFADGMVDEIITGLSRIKWLSVISRNSTFIYKNKQVVIKEVADKLGARYVLEGGVRKSGNRVRVTAQLIDTQTDSHLWAQQYDRVLEDVFALQDELTMCVIGAIEPSLRKAEIDRVRRQRPNNLSAYDLVLRALPSFFTQMAKDAAIAIPLLENAVKLQPDYGAAHAFLGWFLHRRFQLGGRREEDRIAAIQHARAAITHGNDDATALAVAAHVIAFDEHDTTTAIKLFDRALELSNSNVLALSLSAITLAWMGKAELSIERAESAIRLSPYDSYNFRSHYALAITCFSRGQYKEAVEAARNAVDYNPHFSAARAVLAAALLRVGRVTEAKSAARDVLECEPTFTIRAFSLVVELEPAVFGPFADAWREVGLPQ